MMHDYPIGSKKGLTISDSHFPAKVKWGAKGTSQTMSHFYFGRGGTGYRGWGAGCFAEAALPPPCQLGLIYLSAILDVRPCTRTYSKPGTQFLYYIMRSCLPSAPASAPHYHHSKVKPHAESKGIIAGFASCPVQGSVKRTHCGSL